MKKSKIREEKIAGYILNAASKLPSKRNTKAR
jgi:hypothetical protein